MSEEQTTDNADITDTNDQSLTLSVAIRATNSQKLCTARRFVKRLIA